MEQVWNFLSSNEVTVIANLFNIVLALVLLEEIGTKSDIENEIQLTPTIRCRV